MDCWVGARTHQNKPFGTKPTDAIFPFSKGQGFPPGPEIGTVNTVKVATDAGFFVRVGLVLAPTIHQRGHEITCAKEPCTRPATCPITPNLSPIESAAPNRFAGALSNRLA